MKKSTIFILVLVGLIIVVLGFWSLQKKRLNTLIVQNKAPEFSDEATFVSTGATIFVQCIADFDQIKTGLIEIEPKLWLRAWTTCVFKDENRDLQTITLPLWVENGKTQSLFISLAATSVPFYSENGPSNYDFINQMLKNVLNLSQSKGTQKVEVVTGKESGLYLDMNDPLNDLLSSSVGDQMLIFGKTGIASALPSYPGLEFPVIFPYRIEHVQ